MASTLVIVRHGESTWNQENRFTGWHDVSLTAEGERQATAAGVQMREAGLFFHVGHTSLQTRAVVTANLALASLGQPWLPVQRLAPQRTPLRRVAGPRQEGNDDAAWAEQTNLWRRSYDVPPPPVSADSPEHPSHDPALPTSAA